MRQGLSTIHRPMGSQFQCVLLYRTTNNIEIMHSQRNIAVDGGSQQGPAILQVDPEELYWVFTSS